MTEAIEIECVQTQLSEFNGFDTNLVRLEFAANTLYVRESLLNSIPFFATMMKNKTRNGPILLAGYNAQAIADVLHFVKQGRIKPFIVRNMPDAPGSPRPDIHAGPHRYIRAYIAAHQLDIESVQNSLLDILSAFYLNNLIQPDAILLLSEAKLRTSKLYLLLMEEMARGTQAGFYNARPPNSSAVLGKLKPVYKTVMEQWSPEDFVALTAQIGRFSPKKQRTIAFVAKIDPCLFHNHIRTSPCRTLKRKRDDVVTLGCQITRDIPQTEDRASETSTQIIESFGNGSSTTEDSPTRKRRNISSNNHVDFLDDDATLKEQEHVNQEDFQTLEYEDIETDIDDEISGNVTQQVVKKEIDLSDLSDSTRSQTV